MYNLSPIFTILALISVLAFVITIIWLMIRQISRIFTKEPWKITDTVLSIMVGISFFFIGLFLFMLYIVRPRNITYGGYGIRIPLTMDQKDQNPNIPLDMRDLYGLFEYFFFGEGENYNLNDIYTYERIQNRFTDHMLLTHNETKRFVYILQSHNIDYTISTSYEDIEEIKEIFDPIKMSLDRLNNWSICLPLGKKTNGFATQAARFLTGSSVGGHATCVFIEKNNGLISIYHLDPKGNDLHAPMINKFMAKLNGYFTQLRDLGSEEIPYMRKLTCGVQPTANNTHCVYYVFKMIYFYLEGGAEWEKENLGKHICPEIKDTMNEMKAFGKSIKFFGLGLTGSPVTSAHVGGLKYRDKDLYLSTNDTKVLGRRARPSPMSRSQSFPSVTPSVSLSELESQLIALDDDMNPIIETESSKEVLPSPFMKTDPSTRRMVEIDYDYLPTPKRD